MSSTYKLPKSKRRELTTSFSQPTFVMSRAPASSQKQMSVWRQLTRDPGKKVVGRMTRKFQKQEKRSPGNFCHKSQLIYIDLSIHSFSSTLPPSTNWISVFFSVSFRFSVLIFPSNQTKHHGKQQDSGGWSNWTNWTIHHQGECSAGPSHLCSGSPNHSRTSLLKEGADRFIQGFWHHNFGSK